MKIAIIAPASLIELSKGDYQLMLPHMLESDSYYAEFYRDAQGIKILDNGEAESEECPPDQLFALAQEFGATEIVIPDTMMDGPATIKQAKHFKELALAHPEFDYMGVVQGANNQSCLKTLRYFTQEPWITRVALPRCMNLLGEDFRYWFAIRTNPILRMFQAVHCLGASNNVLEVVNLKSLPTLRGIDTSMPIALGLAGINISSYHYASRPDDYFKLPFVSSNKYHLIKHNVDTFKEWAS